MSSPDKEFLMRVLDRLLDEAYDYATPSIPSHTLQTSMIKLVDSVTAQEVTGCLYIDPYWAVYVNDGRQEILKAPLIWFRNVRDDPRLNLQGVISRFAEWRNLTKEEFRYWSARNREAAKNGTPQPMIVAWGGVGPVAGSFFFDNDVGMRGYLPIARKIVEDETLAFIETELGTLLRPEKNPADGLIS